MSDLEQLARDVLHEEAALLDGQRWRQWLDLYTEDCEYWMPTWKIEHELTADPRREVSLIYYGNRAGLEERVWRIEEGRPPSAFPLPRTQHNLSNIVARQAPSGRIAVAANWVVNQYNLRSKLSEHLFGRYEYELVKHNGRWKIARKKIVLLNEIPPVLDFYCL